ncbi:MAG: cyclodeaminase/cyclohydrolase family protein, partial [Chloroflexi bacterium]|nr:cyclodeaminase/cyclohydrolase family protein [Chloroflexota bacterium]
MAFVDLTVAQFCDELGSGNPTPGGGAAAGLMAKLAASLVMMVVNHTIGRPKYASVEERMQSIRVDAEGFSRRAGELMDDDSIAFAAVSAAFRIPREDEGRAAAVSDACKRATEVPLEVMRTAQQLAKLAVEIFSTGNQTLTGDARSALYAARAAAE